MALANCVYTYPHPAHRDSIVDCPGVPFTAVAPSADAVQQMLDAATRAFADAGTSSERVEVISDLLASWYAAWPATAVTDEHEGIAHQIVALINAAEARAAECPCLPGAPTHRHGVGGYSTAPKPADADIQTHHVIAFAGDGTWALEHPLGCRDASLDFDCPVRLLAERQLTSDLTALMAGGRYTCHAGDLGDLFQLGDRLHDDQCTQPLCAACGCWCHAEEQTDDEAAQALASELPGWVLDLVRGLVRYEHDHPKVYRYGGGEAWCPCDLLKALPAEVLAQAERKG